MITLRITDEAKSDVRSILEHLTDVAGELTAQKYDNRFADALEQIQAMPASGALRPYLGADTRIILVLPYILIYDYNEADNHLVLLRVVHGKRNVTERLVNL